MDTFCKFEDGKKTVSLLVLHVLIITTDLTDGCVSPLFPHGPDHGDTNHTVGSGDDVIKSYTGQFHFAGTQYSEVFISVDGSLKFINDIPALSSTPFISPYLQGDIALTDNLGEIFSRQSNTWADVHLAETAINLYSDSESDVTSVVVVTWLGVQQDGASDSDPQNSFQIVLALTADDSMYAIFVYDEIAWPTGEPIVNIGGNTVTIFAVILSDILASTDKHFCTNIGVPGRTVIQVDNYPIPSPGPIQCIEPFCSMTCYVTSDGNVTQYDGAPGTLGTFDDDDKVVLTNNNVPQDNPCKFLVKAKFNKKGRIEWLAVNLAVHENPDKHERSFSLGQFGMTVWERGEGIKAQRVYLPYEWGDGNTSVKITRDNGALVVTSMSACGYTFYYKPGHEPTFRAVVRIDGKQTTTETCGQVIVP